MAWKGRVYGAESMQTTLDVVVGATNVKRSRRGGYWRCTLSDEAFAKLHEFHECFDRWMLVAVDE